MWRVGQKGTQGREDDTLVVRAELVAAFASLSSAFDCSSTCCMDRLA